MSLGVCEVIIVSERYILITVVMNYDALQKYKLVASYDFFKFGVPTLSKKMVSEMKRVENSSFLYRIRLSYEGFEASP
jgi:hypothetical protein